MKVLELTVLIDGKEKKLECEGTNYLNVDRLKGSYVMTSVNSKEYMFAYAYVDRGWVELLPMKGETKLTYPLKDITVRWAFKDDPEVGDAQQT